MNDSKDKITYNVCEGHTFKSEKDLYKVCPSKLSKEELENLYFVLLDSNTQQKKTINRQTDEIKVLNTKLQRKTGQKVFLGNKDCCSGSRVVISEQKDSIADLQRANDRLSDRIKILNMRLCSAKQFLRRGSQAASYCSKCFSSTSMLKNISTSALSTKRSESNLHIPAKSCQIFNRDKTQPLKSTRSTSIQVDMLPSCLQDVCEQNKCRNTIDELKQKILNLEEELSKIRAQYKENLNKLESEVNTVRRDNIRVRADYNSILENLQDKEKECDEVLEKLRNMESQCDNLNADLMIEKSKVSELETQVKASDISEQITKALEAYMKRNVLLLSNTVSGVENKNLSNIATEDSGYTETNKSQEYDKKDSSKNSEELEEKEDVTQHIANLQAQLDNIQRSLEEQKRKENYNILEDSLKANCNDNNTLPNVKCLEESNLPHSSLQVQDDLLISIESPTLVTEQSLSKVVSKIPLPIKPARMTNSNDNFQINDTNEKNNEKKPVEKGNETVINDESNNNDTGRELFNDKIIIKDDKPQMSKETFENDTLKSNLNKIETDYNINMKNNDEKLTKNSTDDTLLQNENSKTKVSSNRMNVLEISAEKSSANNTFVIEKKKLKKNRAKSFDVDMKADDLDIKNKMKPLATSSPTKMRRGSILTYMSDNTDCEISSLTDILNDGYDKSPIDYISPGEERFLALSSSTITTTDYGSLSEGELPVTEVKRMSITELAMKNKMAESNGKTSKHKMEEALSAVGTELMKCRELLYTQRNGTLASDKEMFKKFSYPYNFTLPLQ